jgi:hypothetical protein
MQTLIEVIDLGTITAASLSLALLLQWVALKGVFRLMRMPVRNRAAR